MTEAQKFTLCKAALRIIEMSYRERILRDDLPPYVFAGEILTYIGEDVELIPDDQDAVNELMRAFRHWHYHRNDEVAA